MWKYHHFMYSLFLKGRVTMKDFFLTSLRRSSTTIQPFREAAHALSRILATEASAHIPLQAIKVQTPLGEASGTIIKQRIVLATILRAGLAMLPAFEELFPSAPVGFFGIRRDEKTAEPHLYYQNLPEITPHDWVLLVDPMLATGGSATVALSKLEESGAALSQTLLISIVSAQPGVDAIRKRFPKVTLITGATDPSLNNRKFIMPGLGDFGDRYFGT